MGTGIKKKKGRVAWRVLLSEIYDQSGPCIPYILPIQDEIYSRKKPRQAARREYKNVSLLCAVCVPVDCVSGSGG